MNIELFEVAPGQWGFRVGGIYQEYDPDLPGNTPMTQEVALQKAQIVQARVGQ